MIAIKPNRVSKLEETYDDNYWTKYDPKNQMLSEKLSSHNRISRQTLRMLIMQTLNISDAHAVNNWITKLLALNKIRVDSETLPSSGKPSSKTFYIVINKQNDE